MAGHRCRGPADVLQAVRFAGESDLLVAVRALGHNVAWARALFAATEPQAIGTAYVNFLSEDDGARPA